MAGKLLRLPGTPPELGMYEFTGDLTTLKGPGRRVVRDLEAIRVFGPPDALAVLAAFPDLRRLALGGIDGLRLEPLAALELERLAISGGRNLDLASLADMKGLEQLVLSGLEQCRVPDQLPLAPTLRSLTVLIDPLAGQTPDALRCLTVSIDWAAIRDLRTLVLRAVGTRLPVTTPLDLGFLLELRELRQLEILAGVYHAGGGASPLEPPFDGLSRKLEYLRIESRHASRLSAQLRARFPALQLAVFPTLEPLEDASDVGDWALTDPDPEEPDAVWQTYGSLADAFEDVPYDEEHEAMRMARARLRRVDRKRAARIEFDSEADGTGIYAPTRDDLEWALSVLGLGGRPQYPAPS